MREGRERKEDRVERVGKGEIALIQRCRLIGLIQESN